MNIEAEIRELNRKMDLIIGIIRPVQPPAQKGSFMDMLNDAQSQINAKMVKRGLRK